MDHLAENLALLAQRQPELVSTLAKLLPERVEIFRSASGSPTARIVTGDSAIPLHSRYDPVKEARHSVARADLAGADHYVLLGFGLGYILDALLEKGLEPDSAIFIVESDLQILRAALSARDLRPLLSHPRLHFAWPVSGPALAAQWKSFLDPVRARKNAYLAHPPSVGLAPELFRAALEIIQSETFQIFTDINTLVADSRTFLENFQRNLRYAFKAPGVSGFAGQFQGIPGIIVSAGPSLDRNIHELRGCADHVLLLATDTTLKPLLAAGVEPHFIMTGDPGYANYLHLKGAEVRNSILVAEATAHPACFEQFEGRTVVCSYENSSLRPLSEILNHKGILRAWGSVATMALDFAFVLGCEPIVFVGQDLAYSDGRTYCTGLHFQNDWFPAEITPEQWRQKWDELRSHHKTIRMQDIFGRPVETTKALAAYWNWIVKEIDGHPGIRFVNATEGGILKEGVEVISLREALFRFGSRECRLQQRVRDLFERCLAEPLGSGAAVIRRLSAEARTIESILNIENLTDRPVGSKALQSRLEQRKERIYREAPGLARLLDCFNQKGNLEFLRRRGALRDSSPSSEIVDIYRDYLGTVGKALDILKPAIQGIEETMRSCHRDNREKAGMADGINCQQ